MTVVIYVRLYNFDINKLRINILIISDYRNCSYCIKNITNIHLSELLVKVIYE